MKADLFKLALDVVTVRNSDQNISIGAPIPGLGVKKVSGRALYYSDRHRGQWFRPEYIENIQEIQIAQDTDSYLFKAVQKKVNRFMIAGWEFVSENPEALKYIKRRIKELETISGVPFNQLMIQTAADLARYSNCMWVKVRNKDASSGKVRTATKTKELEPVAGYFILPFETLSFKTTVSGEIKKVKQKIPASWGGTAREKEFFPEDVIHFFCNRKPGFSIGTPEMLPVLEDISLLRRLEENIEIMIDANLNPLFHYMVGSDTFPERYGPDGEKETDIVKRTIEYMPAGGIFVSDHRHKIEAIGSEGRSLRVEGYLEYFKKRVFAGLGMSGVDFGEGDTSNRSTAQTLSKGAIQDVEALQLHMKLFIENYIIDELLLEGNYDVVDINNKVGIKFGIIDKEEKSKEENQTIQLWLNKLITEKEARKRLGEKPLADEDRDENYFKLYEEPLAMLKAIGNVAAGEALAGAETSAITQEGVNRHIKEEKSKAETRGASPNSSSTGARRASSNTSRPRNQYGTRSAPKFNKDIALNEEFLLDLTSLDFSFKDGCKKNNMVADPNQCVELDLLKEKLVEKLKDFDTLSKIRIEELEGEDIKPETVLRSLRWRYDELVRSYNLKAYDLGLKIEKLAL